MLCSNVPLLNSLSAKKKKKMADTCFPIAEGGAKTFGVFRVKNHDFTQKNHIFSNFRGARAGCATPLDPP